MPKTDQPLQSAGWLLLATICLSWGCGGGGGGGSSDAPGNQPPAAQWTSRVVRAVNAGGLTTPRLDGAVDASGVAHLFFFEDSGDSAAPYAVRHLEVDPATDPATPPHDETVVRLDNCSGLAPTVLAGTRPAVLYQGGLQRDCGAPRQSDAMLSLTDGTEWQEFTAATGVVERNPVFLDGLAGTSVAAAADGAGRIHATYQFYYEACDAMTFAYPDLRYVSAVPTELDPLLGLTEETVEGNDYDGANAQNRVGDQVCLAVDGADRPVVFYSAQLADGIQGLRVARREAGDWVRAWVETECEIGPVSCAASPADGEVRAAYQVVRYTDGRDDMELLRYAEPDAGGWQTTTVDDRSRCGDGCSLAFSAAGEPAIAYRSAFSHTGRPLDDLKLARRDGATWDTEEVATTGDLGHGNRLWIDGDVTHIATYSQAQRMIFLVSR